MCRVKDNLDIARSYIDAIDYSKVRKHYSENRKCYKVGGVDAVVSLLHDEDGAEIQVINLGKGAVMPTHSHKQTETYFVLEGDFIIESEGEVASIVAGEQRKMNPEVAHKASSSTGCRLILVRTPSSKELRDG